VEQRWCFPIPMTMQRHTGWRFAPVRPEKPNKDLERPNNTGNAGLLERPEPCESKGETRD
jgi:hypothetical protein